MSPPEVKLWNVLRTRPQGFKFRRQRSDDPYIFDFYCHGALLAIEIDGLAHDYGNNPERDAARDRWAADKSIATLRIAASEVHNNLDGMVACILQRCAERTPPPAPLVPLPSNSRGG